MNANKYFDEGLERTMMPKECLFCTRLYVLDVVWSQTDAERDWKWGGGKFDRGIAQPMCFAIHFFEKVGQPHAKSLFWGALDPGGGGGGGGELKASELRPSDRAYENI